MSLWEMVRPRAFRLFKKLRDGERGGIGIVLLFVIFAALLLVPFFIDFSSVEYSRRVAQTGGDAGAMAGARVLADNLALARERPAWWTRWTEPSAWYTDPEAAKLDRRREAVRLYRDEYYLRALRSAEPEKFAFQYATANIPRLRDWDFQMTRSGRVTRVEGYDFWDIRLRVACERPVELYGRNVYGKDLQAPATATSEVYLRGGSWRFDHELVDTRWVCDAYCTTPAGVVYCCASHLEYKYRARVYVGDQWKIQLIK